MNTQNQNVNRSRRRDNSAFLALYRGTCAMGASILRAGAALTKTQQEALIADLRSGDEERAKAALMPLGISQSAIDEQRRLVSKFMAQYPLPEGPAQVRVIVENAYAFARVSYPDGGGPAPDPFDEVRDELGLPNPDEPGGSGDNATCLALCEAWAVAQMGIAVAVYSAALAGCLATGPLWPVCAAGVTAAYVLDILGMKAISEDCVENCG